MVARWQTALIRQAVQGTAFQSSMPGSVEDYAFYVYTVSVSNKGLLGARMAELQVVPKEGDVLSYSPAASLLQNVNLPVDIPAGTTRNLQCILLTRQGSNAVRELYLTYYNGAGRHHSAYLRIILDSRGFSVMAKSPLIRRLH